MTLLAPYGLAVIGVLLVVVAAVAATIRWRLRRLRALGFMPQLPLLRLAALIGGLLLLAVAAAQPAVPSQSSRRQRTDAQIWLVVDTSNSMLARSKRGTPTRLTQAKQFALSLQRQLPTVPIGISVMTNRVLPLLPPTVDQSIFKVVVYHSIRANTPPPLGYEMLLNDTSFYTLTDFANYDFFAGAKKKLVIVVSDMQTIKFAVSDTAAQLKKAHIGLLLARLGKRSDQIYLGNHIDRAYNRSLGYPQQAKRLADQFGQPMFTLDPARVAAAARAQLGSGPTSNAGSEHMLVSLSPYLELAALPLLVFALLDLLGGAWTAAGAAGLRSHLTAAARTRASRSEND